MSSEQTPKSTAEASAAAADRDFDITDLVKDRIDGACGHGATWLSPYRTLAEDEEPSLDAQQNDPEPPPGGFEYAEHRFLGNQLIFKYMGPKSETDRTPDGKEVDRRGYELPLKTLGKGNDVLYLTYGEISALAGDFYGTMKPISDGKTDQDRRDRFMAAFNTLADNPDDQPRDARQLLKHLRAEIEGVEKAIRDKKDPSTYYKAGEGLAGMKAIDELIKGRHFPSYSELLKINWDHFGDDARTAYTTGHAAAIHWAASGEWTVDRLVEAYAMNAFADHYLQDLFSSGHMRVPRRVLHGYEGLADVLANLMHDEDCAIGLTVSNKNGMSWTAYGDKRLLDADNKANLLNCQAAMQISAREVYDAWKGRKELAPSAFAVWNLVPTKESAMAKDTGHFAPLFLLGPKQDWNDLWRRKSLKNRRNWEHTKSWTTLDTLWKAKVTKAYLWRYPIRLDPQIETD
ncbi:phosphatidylcholine-hydrolyzing phospholipase C [Cordyceps militaris CM01]|uniref:Phosphatidylcholine-hydrolyzing phospholipase C n=1 Tax=Cordyceps militaris (strain CM01) TaxID=983644 RepID=G3J474_CORMM|nr:phosphatidylcholine-hydrolyzing phospholipase C [Cordyceps militaris CM01]EGX95796.1 phosphatidylcholine-hydrolyzing phospholipase C [Cordyceps militaris CM01]